MSVFPQEPQTYASHVLVCGECGTPVQHLCSDWQGGPAYLRPCGHTAVISVIPNPSIPK